MASPMLMYSTMSAMESNRILAGLTDAGRERLAPHLKAIEPAYGTALIEQDQQNPVVYLPLQGAVLSMTRTAENGTTVEVGVIGREGIGGISAFLEPARSIDRGQVQAVGTFYELSTSALDAAIVADATLRALVFRYMNAFLMQVTQTALCNRLHAVEQRLARWLLMMHDRTGTDEMRMTQEFLAHMLGTRLAGVNEAIQSLERIEAISHARQRVTVNDRAALEGVACECYEVIRGEFRLAAR